MTTHFKHGVARATALSRLTAVIRTARKLQTLLICLLGTLITMSEIGDVVGRFLM
jgi:hypothetical protein